MARRTGIITRLLATVAVALAAAGLTLAAGAATTRGPVGAARLHPNGVAAFAIRTGGGFTHVHTRSLASISPRLAAQSRISKCGGRNAEVEEALQGPYAYVEWIGCFGIGFAVSTNGGKTWGPPIKLPGSGYTRCTQRSCSGYPWDPAVAIAPNGAVYAAFMYQFSSSASPVVDASTNRGKSFTSIALPVPPSTDPKGSWGDRDFLAVGPNGTIYLTWDYGPSSSQVTITCSPIGSCSFSGGDLNAVLQVSKNGGKTWSAVAPISPHFPYGGADSAPIVATPTGGLDVLYQAFPTAPTTHSFKPGNEYFTRSSNGGKTWSTPKVVGKQAGTVSLTEWWIDGNLSLDSAGNLYATWDTQRSKYDVGWMSVSRNQGSTWSAPLAVTSPKGTVEELTESAGVGKGLADVAWQTPTPKGYTTFVRPYSVTKGWLAGALQVSTLYGSSTIWPGDTFGIGPVPTSKVGKHGPALLLTWGSAVAPSANSEIWGRVVTP